MNEELKERDPEIHQVQGSDSISGESKENKSMLII